MKSGMGSRKRLGESLAAVSRRLGATRAGYLQPDAYSVVAYSKRLSDTWGTPAAGTVSGKSQR